MPRPSTPNAILKLRGSRWCNRLEPKPKQGSPECPDWLDEVGRQVWDALLPQLEDMKVMTKIDGLALARYCHSWTIWDNCRRWIDQHGMVYPIKNKDGSVKCFMQYPQVGILHKSADTLRRLEQEFGLTPSSRTRIQVKENGRQGYGYPDPFEKLGAAG